MTNKLKIILVAIIFLVKGYLSFATILNDRDVTHSEPVWSCEYIDNKWKCNVAFEIQNISNKEKTGTLVLRAMATEGTAKSKSVEIGEPIQVEFNLYGYEEKAINETIFSKKKPSVVNITILSEINM